MQESNRRSSQSMPILRSPDVSTDDYANFKGPSLLKRTLGLQRSHHGMLLGLSGQHEPALTRICQRDDARAGKAMTSLRQVSDRDSFVMLPDEGTYLHEDEINDLDIIEATVYPYGKALINLYFRIVHPSFPILHKKVYLEKYERSHREFSPPLLATVYILALNFWSYSSDLASQKKPDVIALENLASKAIGYVTHRPKISTVEAGLLLLQRPNGDSWPMTATMVAVSQEIGLHLDCSGWKIPSWERGLRKRLAWALFMQDTWASLVHGRPLHIDLSNWAVQTLSESDFPESALDEDDEEGSTEVEKGRQLFMYMVSLTRILAEILRTFYSIAAEQEFLEHSLTATRLALARAKPLQLRLKEWHANLPTALSMEDIKIRKLSSTGYLHLAYYAAEITLHRRIIRTLSTCADAHLFGICRSAARARLVSAMGFVNRLKAEHLQSFWYFASKFNFALIGIFQCLLCATSIDTEEAQFYAARLDEYRWTLRVSSRNAEFLEQSLSIFDQSATALRARLLEGSMDIAANAISASEETREIINGATAQEQGLKFFEDSHLVGDGFVDGSVDLQADVASLFSSQPAHTPQTIDPSHWGWGDINYDATLGQEAAYSEG